MEIMDKKITVHIADDHQIIIDGLSAILDFESDIEVVGFSLNGRQVLEWFQNNTADVLLLDINMPDVNGVEVLKGFKEYQTSRTSRHLRDVTPSRAPPTPSARNPSDRGTADSSDRRNRTHRSRLQRGVRHPCLGGRSGSSIKPMLRFSRSSSSVNSV